MTWYVIVRFAGFLRSATRGKKASVHSIRANSCYIWFAHIAPAFLRVFSFSGQRKSDFQHLSMLPFKISQRYFEALAFAVQPLSLEVRFVLAHLFAECVNELPPRERDFFREFGQSPRPFLFGGRFPQLVNGRAENPHRVHLRASYQAA
jgi:hypothetical protein